MRIALVTESFLPDVNGVAHSVVRTAEHLVRRGHDPLVIAPQPPPGVRGTVGELPYPVVRIPSLRMPGYPQVRLGLPTPALNAALRGHRTEIVHLASPFFLGAWGAAAAKALQYGKLRFQCPQRGEGRSHMWLLARIRPADGSYAVSRNSFWNSRRGAGATPQFHSR